MISHHVDHCFELCIPVHEFGRLESILLPEAGEGPGFELKCTKRRRAIEIHLVDCSGQSPALARLTAHRDIFALGV